LGTNMLLESTNEEEVKYISKEKVLLAVLDKKDWLKVNSKNVNYLYSNNILPRLSPNHMKILS